MTPITIEPNSGVKKKRIMKPKQKSLSGLRTKVITCDLKTLKGIEMVPRPKQKSVTMWAIWSPFIKKFCCVGLTRNAAWIRAVSPFTKEHLARLKKNGYRAVKGEFVWEENCGGHDFTIEQSEMARPHFLTGKLLHVCKYCTYSCYFES